MVEQTPNWKPVMKRPIVVHVRPATTEDEEDIRQREGDVLERLGFESEDEVWPHYYIMRGVEGEEYPIHENIFARTYEFVEEEGV